jgi:hypothetical protein
MSKQPITVPPKTGRVTRAPVEEWRARRAEKWRAERNAEYLRMYGITLEQAEAMEKYLSD